MATSSSKKKREPLAHDNEKVRNLESLARVTKVVQLLDICLQSSSSFINIKGITELESQRQYYADAELIEPDENNLLFNVICNLGIRETAPATDEEVLHELLLVEASFNLSYQLKNMDNISLDDLSVFARINALHNAWPYWREFVQNMTMRMGIQPITLRLKSPVIAR